MKKYLFLFSLTTFIIHGCQSKNESNLSAADRTFIHSIIPLDEGEKIELFETNGGFKGLKTSGNFMTNKRIATYWIDGKSDAINSTTYEEIDSIKTIDLVKAISNASYLEVYTGDNKFNVYVDADSSRTWQFFNQAIENWRTSRR